MNKKQNDMKWIKRLFCHHDYNIFIRNIYGDEIHATGGKRSVWKCSKCGKIFYAPHMNMMHCVQDQCKKKDQCYRYWLGQNAKYSASPYASYYQPDKPVTDGCEFYINKDYFD